MNKEEKNTFSCLDGHTCGNPVRLIIEGVPELEGKTMSEKRLSFMKDFDWIRKGLMYEPRGHDMMSGGFLYPPANSENDCGIVFIETSGCLPMCGHGTIGMITMGIENGLIRPKEEGVVKLEVPAGDIIINYRKEGEKVTGVRITNVPSFLYKENLKTRCSDLGELIVDVAYGGNFYAIVDPQENFSDMGDYTVDQLISWSREIRSELNKDYSFHHPLDESINGLSHVQWTGKPGHENSDLRNAVFYGDKAIDRSPCGTGTSARMAQRFAKGLLSKDDVFVHESIIGSQFIGRIEDETSVGEFNAIVPSIEGWARQTGTNTITIDPEDPYAFGFQVI